MSLIAELKRRTPEQIIAKLREAEGELGRSLRDAVVSAQEVSSRETCRR